MEQILEEMRRLRDDVKASQEEAALQVARSSKRDPYHLKGKGMRTSTPSMTIVPASPEKLFRAIVHTKTGERLRESGGLSYSRLRELLSDRIQGLGMDPKQFGMHSLRAGGATAAANAGMPDRLFKRHVAGNQSQPKMAMLRTQWRGGSPFPRVFSGI